MAGPEENSENLSSGKYNSATNYRSILKATSLFGGVQAYQILIGVISSKLVAVLLGPLGIGIKGLFQSSTQFISAVTSLGLSRSAVRDVSLANGTGDKHRIGATVAALRRLMWFTGILGMATTVLLSPLLSKTAFGNYDYTIPFIFLSITLLLNQLSAGQMVVLQGLRKLHYLAKASAIGSTFGLLISIPLYYLLGIKGIVPTLILNALASLLLSWYFSKKVSIERVHITTIDAFQEGKTMMKMGVVMSVSSMLSLLFAYALRGFIRHQSGIETVGVFTAGFAIINTYVGMIFDAMIKDFYPRLSASSNNNAECAQLINQQAEIGTLIMAPMLIGCLVFMPFILRLLYSDKFSGATDYVLWAIPGMFFKLASWAISLLFVAKGISRLYLSNDIFGHSMIFIFSIGGFFLFEMKGLGIGFTLGYFVYLIKVWLNAKKEFGFSFTISFIIPFLVQFSIVTGCFICVLTLSSAYKYLAGTALLLLSSFFSIKGINARTDVISLLRNRFSNE